MADNEQPPADEGTEPDKLRDRIQAMAPVLRTLPRGTHVCVMQEGDELYLYNITRAFELIEGRQPETTVNVAERAKLIHPRDAGELPDDKVQIDPARAETVDLSYPVLVVAGRDELDGSRGRVIDGWHRIYRASRLGIAELPAIVISPDEEQLIRIDPGGDQDEG
ncbi:MAG TPA: hypothetical protein VFB58_06260 [Chloroflexota bacterium]|nr:hypothetical protein [Chloroflexota bacterium]